MPNYSIIIATKNEEEGIAKVLCSIPKVIAKKSEIIVADSSDDLTPTIAEKLGAKVLEVKKIGKGYAMRKAAKIAKGEILIFLDGDGTDPPYYIPKLLKKLKKCDIVLGNRSLIKNQKDDKKYKIIYVLWHILVIPIFRAAGFKTKGDPIAGFRAMKKKIWNKLNLKSNDFLIETEMNLRAVDLRLKVCEVPIPNLKRAGGFLNSKLATNPKQSIKILNYVLKRIKNDRVNGSIEKNIKSFKKLFMN